MDMLLCVNDVMFNKMKFAGAEDDYYYTPQASCIDKVRNSQYMLRITCCVCTLYALLRESGTCETLMLESKKVSSLVLSRMRL
jgi:hypothetical protein